jgi:prepilin-type N-terminal cleavage/methylation domain-containing protein
MSKSNPSNDPALSKRSASNGPALSQSNGFTLVEVLIGMSLALMVMTAVLSSYTTLGRNFTRSLGLASANHIAYSFNSATGILTRTPANGTAQTLHTNVLNAYFRYFDGSGNPYDNGSSPYTTVTTYFSGVKQVSLTLFAQAGSATNGTLSPIYETDSPRLILRNKGLLP